MGRLRGYFGKNSYIKIGQNSPNLDKPKLARKNSQRKYKMLTNIEQEYCERAINALDTLSREIKALRESVEKCIGKPVQDEHPQEEQQEVQTPENEGFQFDCIAVTDVQVFPFKEGMNLGHMKGMASVTLNGQLVVRGLRIMDGENGLFVGYPNDPFYKGEDFRSICFPITRQLREHIENCVLEKYQASIE